LPRVQTERRLTLHHRSQSRSGPRLFRALRELPPQDWEQWC